MYKKHQNVFTGDMSFIEGLITSPNLKLWHMDSYNNYEKHIFNFTIITNNIISCTFFLLFD
jgi:hypothetical protein